MDNSFDFLRDLESLNVYTERLKKYFDVNNGLDGMSILKTKVKFDDIDLKDVSDSISNLLKLAIRTHSSITDLDKRIEMIRYVQSNDIDYI